MLLIRNLHFLLQYSFRSKDMYYAVRKGRNVGIFKTWDECKAQVHRFQGAQFKKFSTQEDATNFIGATASKKRPTYSNTEYDAPYKKIRVKNGYGGNSYASNYNTSSYEKPRVVYTDGCCTSNGRSGARAGIGVYWGPDHPWNVSEKLHGHQTNQRAELKAAVRAIEVAKENDLNDIELKTDSIYTIKCVTDWIDKWKENGWKTSKNGNVVNRDLIEDLDEARQDINVTWRHVPGHKGIQGNEEADRLANLGAALRK
ncbi:ribonuclease H1-like [Anneissia japonica]|uniref:ribonuclease H1-like n=1 Tax=Anneissia japonica TaxID=1529436 RepID=UPI001425A5B5|nr:ribonuclease H1-like [Anneissia japonica]